MFRRGMFFVMYFVFGRMRVLRSEKFFFAPESHRHQARHVKRGAGRGDGPHQPNNPTHGNMSRRGGVPKNFVFRPETAERNNAADSQPTGHKSPIRFGHVLAQSAHFPHVLFVMHAMDNAAGAEEHQGLEKRMGHHVEDADRKRADAARDRKSTRLNSSHVSAS